MLDTVPALPEFLQLAPEKVEAENERQAELRKAFNSRARLSPLEIEESRAAFMEPDLREWAAKYPEEYANRHADTLGTLGRFAEAAAAAIDADLKAFYTKAAAATREQCGCPAKTAVTGGKRVQIPAYRTIKEFATYDLAECNTCEKWMFIEKG